MVTYSKERIKLLKERKDVLKLKRELEKEKKELADLKRQKLQLMKFKKEVRALKQSPEVEQYKRLAKKGLKVAGKGVGSFLKTAYRIGERVTRPDNRK